MAVLSLDGHKKQHVQCRAVIETVRMENTFLFSMPFLCIHRIHPPGVIFLKPSTLTIFLVSVTEFHEKHL